MIRFGQCSLWLARCILFMLIVTFSIGLSASASVSMPSMRPAADSARSDQALFQQIATRVASGEDYYIASAHEHRLRSYPLFPFVAVRPPALTYLRVSLGSEKAFGALLLCIAVLATIGMTFRAYAASSKLLVGAAVGLLSAVAVTVAANSPLFHDAWASLLLMLALVCRSERHYIPSALIALLAILIREMALPFVPVMLLMALHEQRRPEALVWAVILSIACLFFWSHATAVETVRSFSDLRSPGWVASGGWPFVLRVAHAGTSFMLFPMKLVALLVPLALLGWSAIDHPLAKRSAFYLIGMVAAFTVVGRPDNEYWGILIGPLLPIGLVAAPAALYNLARAARKPTSSRASV